LHCLHNCLDHAGPAGFGKIGNTFHQSFRHRQILSYGNCETKISRIILWEKGLSQSCPKNGFSVILELVPEGLSNPAQSFAIRLSNPFNKLTALNYSKQTGTAKDYREVE